MVSANKSFVGIISAATIIALLLPSLSIAASDKEVQVTVYDGPTDCPQDETDPLTKIRPDDTVGLHFTVTIDATSQSGTRGETVESSHDKGIAPTFPVGQGKVIAGLDIGLIGLCKNSKAYIVIPPHLAYGDHGVPNSNVPGGATLRYDVEIIHIQPPTPNDFVKIDANEDGRLSKKEAREYFEKMGQAIELDALWKEEDKDGNGYISWEEFSGRKGDGPPQKQQQQQRQRQQARPDPRKEVAATFHAMDTDKDGRINKSELGEAFKAMGSEMTDEFWRESDGNGDGYISFTEFVGIDDERGGQDEL